MRRSAPAPQHGHRSRASCIAADDPGFVHFIEARGRGIFLRAAPIDVAAHRPRRRARRPPARRCSRRRRSPWTASFDYALGRLGVPDAATLRLPSEFDFRDAGALCICRRTCRIRGRPISTAPPPASSPRSSTARRGARSCCSRPTTRCTTCAGASSGRLPWPLLVQGTASRTALLRDFRATPNAVLLATASFWQGVDVAGEALSCVIVDRLPFASPGDPLVAARMQATTARGGHAFHEYQVPLATLTLLQGLGRLIRTHTDRGVLAVLDPRLTRMSYETRQRYLSSDHDPLFEFHRWKANLRI